MDHAGRGGYSVALADPPSFSAAAATNTTSRIGVPSLDVLGDAALGRVPNPRNHHLDQGPDDSKRFGVRSRGFVDKGPAKT
jgi:hypothetical protein